KEGKMLDLLIVPLRTFLSFASIPTSIRHVTCALPSNALPLSPANQALLPLSTCQDLSKQFYVSWEPAKDKHLLRLSLLTQKEKISYSTKITLNLPKAVFQQNPTLPFLLKRFVYHLGFDGGILDDNPEGLKNLNNFFKYAAIQEAWDAFDPAGIQKNNLRCAIYDFCDQLRVGLRMLFLNLATHCTAPQNYVERTDPQYLPKTAARGNTTFYENTHYLVPYSLIQNSPDEKKGYGTKAELNWLLGPNNSKINQVLDATSFNEPYDSQFHIILNHTPLSLPITIQVNEQRIEYNDQEYKELDGEADTYHSEGYAVTLQTEVSSRPIAVRVVYAPDDLKEERFPLALSWQIAQLKARIYEHHQTLGGIPLSVLEQNKVDN
ncbi:MAG: hypothetical protein KDK71_07610, partial [Chlamydiia bacterium]|nr:hypothetical protein [Chlamydiia bacterium]